MLSGNGQENNGHRERLRQRFLQSWLEGFGEHEIVELLLTLGTPRRDCKPMARQAIRRFKNLKGVLEAPAEELRQIDGLGQRNIIGLKVIRSVAERLLKDRAVTGTVYTSAEDVYQYLKLSISSSSKEVFKVLFLNNRNRLLEIEEASRGTVNRSSVYPREVMERALKHQASGLIFAHNHPSGCLEPSPEDKALTRTLVFAAVFLQMKVLDHLIITRDGYYSFASHGLIERWEAEYIKLGMKS